MNQPNPTYSVRITTTKKTATIHFECRRGSEVIRSWKEKFVDGYSTARAKAENRKKEWLEQLSGFQGLLEASDSHHKAHSLKEFCRFPWHLLNKEWLDAGNELLYGGEKCGVDFGQNAPHVVFCGGNNVLQYWEIPAELEFLIKSYRESKIQQQ